MTGESLERAAVAIHLHRVVQIASLALLVFLSLCLTLFAISGNYSSIALILSLIFVFAAAKTPYRKGFIANCFIVGLFLISPFDIKLARGDHLNIKAQRVSYGLPRLNASEAVRQGVVAGGCVETPLSPQWMVVLTVP